LKLLVDTTHFLPAIGISVRGISRTSVQDLQRRGPTISICTITLFELAAKGAKFVASQRLNNLRVMNGLRAILHDPTIGQVSFCEHDVVDRALTVREEVSDFIDCLVLSSAAARADILVTEDEELQDVASREETKARLKPVSHTFRACTARRLP